MKNRLTWVLAPAALGALLCIYTQPAMAQAPPSGPGQQGEFNGENVDTGAAALDSGLEATEGPEAGIDAKLSPVTAATTVIPAGVSATVLGSAQDLDVEGDFDLQEIAGTDTPELN